MLAIGFDPSFIDTLTFAKDQGELLNKLPLPGHHHRNTDITRIAGGNGINVAWTLSKLGHELTLVCPTSVIFDNLLHDRGLNCSIPIDTSINETVAVIWEEGEIQFNSITAQFGKELWTKQIHDTWVNSPIAVSLNWGLNPLSDEWVACQWLASCGISFDQISKTNNVVDLALHTNELKQPFIVESGSFKHHTSVDNLLSLMQCISSTSYEDKYPIILANEEEEQEIKQFNPPVKVIHTNKQIKLYQNSEFNDFVVKLIDCNNPNFVGAGDAFLAGLIDHLLENRVINIPYAIDIAQQYICSKL